MRTRNTLLVSLGAGLLLAVASPLAAAAHVSVSPDTAEPGGYTTFTVRVPNESESESTVQLDLTLPSDTPISSVRYAPTPGWVTETVREQFDPPVSVGGVDIEEAITKITWTAEPGFEIDDGEFAEFAVSLGPIPDVDTLVLVADQHYSDGSVVSWADVGDDAERPAPVLYVGAEAPSGHHGGSETEETDGNAAGADTDAPANASDTTVASSPDVLARVLGVAGLVIGAIGVAFGITARRRAAA